MAAAAFPKDRRASFIAPALIKTVDPASPAARAGLSAGEAIVAAEGEPIRDLIAWRWVACDESLRVTVLDERDRRRSVLLTREEGEDWGITFDGIVFDGVRCCANRCSFCFIDGLPEDVRPTLAVRDDDYRLSFLTGTFVTLTNLSAADERRIVEEGLTPLRVSLHAVDDAVRTQLMGPTARRGLDAIERLLNAGIEMHLQIVLVPGVNDGAVLDRTLRWAEVRPGILSIGIVPVGYTRLSPLKADFSPADARALIGQLGPFQHRAECAGRGAWVFAADEFYGKAYGAQLADALPPATFYGDFELFEDGIGIVRTTIDEFDAALAEGRGVKLAEAIRRRGIYGGLPIIVGGAVCPWFQALIDRSPLRGLIRPLGVENAYFGGNVDVTGLLAGADIAAAIRADRAAFGLGMGAPYALPGILFNDDGLTLDDWDLGRIESASGARLAVVSLIDRRWMTVAAEAITSG